MTAVHNKHLIRIDHFFHIMSDKNDRYVLLFSQTRNRLKHLLAPVRIKHGSRFIQNNTLRLHRDHSCDRHTLLLTAGKFIRRGRPIFRHPDKTQTFPYSFPYLICRYPYIFRSETNIFFYDSSDDLVVRILKYHSRTLSHVPQILRIFRILSVHPYSTACRDQYCIHMLCKSRLSRTVMTENRHKRTLRHININPVNGAVCSDHISFLITFIIFIYKLFRMYHIHRQTAFPGFISP